MYWWGEISTDWGYQKYVGTTVCQEINSPRYVSMFFFLCYFLVNNAVFTLNAISPPKFFSSSIWFYNEINSINRTETAGIKNFLNKNLQSNVSGG